MWVNQQGKGNWNFFSFCQVVRPHAFQLDSPICRCQTARSCATSRNQKRPPHRSSLPLLPQPVAGWLQLKFELPQVNNITDAPCDQPYTPAATKTRGSQLAVSPGCASVFDLQLNCAAASALVLLDNCIGTASLCTVPVFLKFCGCKTCRYQTTYHSATQQGTGHWEGVVLQQQFATALQVRELHSNNAAAHHASQWPCRQ